MRHAISILLIVLIAFSGQCWKLIRPNGDEPAKLSPETFLDKCTMEVIYYQEAIDPELDEIKSHYNILQIGPSISKYSNYGTFRLDSTINKMNGKIITNNEYDLLYQKLDANYTGVTIKHKSSEVIDVYENVFIDHFHYTEQHLDFNWQLEDSTKTICGQLCHKATGTFRGRTWTAWYCDIASSNGPWKFGGLPGLILEAIDSKQEHRFSAVAIRNGSENITSSKRNYYESKREKVRSAMMHYVENYDKMYESLLMNADGSPRKLSKTSRLFYNPIELE